MKPEELVPDLTCKRCGTICVVNLINQKTHLCNKCENEIK